MFIVILKHIPIASLSPKYFKPFFPKLCGTKKASAVLTFPMDEYFFADVFFSIESFQFNTFLYHATWEVNI